MDAKIIKKTQDTLGKIVKKPPLTEKLLSKPPFRFLHDIFTSVIKTTGFMKGLYSDAELNSDNVKDKDSKVAFLQKAVDMVSLVLGKTLSVKPAKVVAGHEPEKTNEFLQQLAEAVNKKINNDDYVQRVLKADGGGKSDAPKKEKKERDRSEDKRKKDKDDKKDKKDRDKHRSEREDRDENKEKEREERKERRHRSEREDRNESKEREREEKKERRHRSEREDRNGSKDREREEKRERRKREKDAEKEKEKSEEPATANGETEPEQVAARMPRPTSAKGSRRRQAHGGRQRRPDAATDEDDDAKPTNHRVADDEKPVSSPGQGGRMARPSSARPAPPKIKQAQPVPDEPTVILGNVGSGHVTNIITDKDDDSDAEEDADAAFVTQEEGPMPLIEAANAGNASREVDPDDPTHGGLVKKMLKTKEELEGGSQTAQGRKTKVDIERSAVQNDATRRKEREMVQKEIEKLRGSIQTLTRSVNPLGKIMDFVQEDLDSMQKELEMWKKENKENQVALQREQSITESKVEPLKAQLTEIDSAIKDQLDLIAAVKANIIRNDDRIEKMLSSVAKS